MKLPNFLFTLTIIICLCSSCFGQSEENLIDDKTTDVINGSEAQKIECLNISKNLGKKISFYNFKRLDNKNQMIKSMKKGEEATNVIEKLKEEGFLKETPLCPTTGKMSYFSEGYFANLNLLVECEVHGFPEPVESLQKGINLFGN